MKFAYRLKIISVMSFSLLLFVTALLIWSSSELRRAERDDMLADEIQTIIFERATARDEFYLHGAEPARLQWLALNEETGQLLRRGVEQLHSDQEDRRIFERVQADFDQSVLISRRLVAQVQRVRSENLRMAHGGGLAAQLYSRIMLKDSALQKGSAALQKSTRKRYNAAQDRLIVLTFLFVLLMGLGTMFNSGFINSLLRKRLAALNMGAAAIASGDFRSRILCEGGDDELAELSRVFNGVTQTVQDYIEALRESEERFRLQLQELTNIYTHTPVGLFAVDRELRFLRLNEQMARLNCIPVQEHLGRNIDETLPAGFVAELKKMWRPVLEHGERVLNLEVQGKTELPDGLRHWLVSFQPLVADTGGVIGLTGSVLDITERKRVEQVMAGVRQQLELEVQNRTANLSLANRHLLQEIEVRKKVEVELLTQQQKLQELALDVSMAEERERDRIASELHDQVGQRLILAKIKIDTLTSKLPSGECEAEAVGIETLIKQTIQDIRSLTFQIRPPLLASAGLEAALRWLGEELQADFGLEVAFSDDGKEKPLRYEVRSTIFQAVRELMLNVAKHAGTKQCRVSFSRPDDAMMIEVEDDGVGLKACVADAGNARSGGFGLLNVRQKIEHLGGLFTIDTKESSGTRATIKVPLEIASEIAG